MEKLEITEAIFGALYPFVIDENVTDIKWNGLNVWIDDLHKGRYRAKDYKGNYLKLEQDWIKSFAAKLSNTMNTNFNNSTPSLQAETDELRIHVVHSFVNGTGSYLLAIRKTPSVSRLAHIDLVATGYVDATIEKLLPAIIKSRLSGFVIGDVGAGKTELEKYLCQFIPEEDGIITVEDTLEMKLTKLYPDKDVASLKISRSYTAVDAIRDALRLLVKWLILSEARGREIVQVMEAASTGCVAMASIHAENAWDVPDRVLNMAGDESRAGFENDIYTFFNYAVKVKKGITENGIQRKIDQVVFFSRENNENKVTIFYKDGKLTGEKLPQVILDKMRGQKEFLDMYNKIFNKEEVEVVETKPSEKVAPVQANVDGENADDIEQNLDSEKVSDTNEESSPLQEIEKEIQEALELEQKEELDKVSELLDKVKTEIVSIEQPNSKVENHENDEKVHIEPIPEIKPIEENIVLDEIQPLPENDNIKNNIDILDEIENSPIDNSNKITEVDNIEELDEIEEANHKNDYPNDDLSIIEDKDIIF